MLGRMIAETGLDLLYGVTVTRIVRAGVEMTAVPGVRLQFGDFLHVVGDPKGIDSASQTLGNSLPALNTTQFIPVFIGLALGVLVGLAPLAMPALSSPLKLGLAGGPRRIRRPVHRLCHALSVDHAFPHPCGTDHGANLFPLTDSIQLTLI